MGYVSGHVPFDPPSRCDICGLSERRSQLRKVDHQLICHSHGRTKAQLDRANASIRAPRILPVPDARPLDLTSPDTFLVAEGDVLNFVSRMVTAQNRRLNVTSGDGAPISSASTRPEFMGWAARYCYEAYAQGDLPSLLLAQAKATLLSAATYLRSIQAGFGIVTTATKSTDYRWGGVTSGATYLTEDIILAGFAFLHAYQATGESTWLASARAVADHLRNIQAIGKYASSNFTSTDAAGSGRLYTGSLLASTSGSATTGTHDFFPSALMALEFWTRLQAITGDINIGADAAVTGFTAAVQQSMSQCIADIRVLWTTGTRDAVSGETYTGLSASTPREFFFAFPVGNGAWGYIDTGDNTGHTITSQTWARAIGALYAVDGASSQVIALHDFLRAFTSNPSTETSQTSLSALARVSLGTYDPAVTLATEMRVKTSAGAATSINESAVYDWGAFGVLSAITSARYRSTFKTARITGTTRKRRFLDGRPSDSHYNDVICLRGRSGLGFQTAQTDSGGLMCNDGQLAAQFGLSFRQQPRVS